jgi:hypothetical protein
MVLRLERLPVACAGSGINSFDNSQTGHQILNLHPPTPSGSVWVAPSGQFAGVAFAPSSDVQLTIPNEFDQHGRVAPFVRSQALSSKDDLLSALRNRKPDPASHWQGVWKPAPPTAISLAGGTEQFIENVMPDGSKVSGVATHDFVHYETTLPGPLADGTWVHRLSSLVQTVVDALPPLSPATQPM